MFLPSSAVGRDGTTKPTSLKGSWVVAAGGLASEGCSKVKGLSATTVVSVFVSAEGATGSTGLAVDGETKPFLGGPPFRSGLSCWTCHSFSSPAAAIRSEEPSDEASGIVTSEGISRTSEFCTFDSFRKGLGRKRRLAGLVYGRSVATSPGYVSSSAKSIGEGGVPSSGA